MRCDSVCLLSRHLDAWPSCIRSRTSRSVLECGGKRSATPLSCGQRFANSVRLPCVRKRRRRCALPAQSKIFIGLPDVSNSRSVLECGGPPPLSCVKTHSTCKDAPRIRPERDLQVASTCEVASREKLSTRTLVRMMKQRERRVPYPLSRRAAGANAFGNLLNGFIAQPTMAFPCIIAKAFL